MRNYIRTPKRPTPIGVQRSNATSHYLRRNFERGNVGKRPETRRPVLLGVYVEQAASPSAVANASPATLRVLSAALLAGESATSGYLGVS